MILVVALGVRIAYVLGEAKGDQQFYDAAYYELQARVIVDGHGYNDPFQFLPGAPHRSTPAADHPPLTVFALIPGIWVGDGLGLSAENTQTLLRFEIALVGLGVVLLIGLLGREVAGDRAGLIAAGIAAVYPYLWVSDGLIMSEAFAGAAVAGALLLAYRLFRRPSLVLALALGLGVRPRRAGARGADPARAAARDPTALQLPQGGVVEAVVGRRGDRGRDAALRRAVGRVQPEPVRGHDLPVDERRHRDVGVELRLRVLRLRPRSHRPPEVHPEAARRRATSRWCRAIYRDRAIDYMKDHKSRVPVVVLARIGRDWSLFRPGDMLDWNQNEGRARWVTGLGLVFYYPLLLAAVGGVVVLRLRRKRQWPLLMPPLIVTIASVLSYGQTRFRAPAEPSLVILAAVGIAALVARWWPEPGPAPTSDSPEEAEPAPVPA